jgi:hypothetical protein
MNKASKCWKCWLYLCNKQKNETINLEVNITSVNITMIDKHPSLKGIATKFLIALTSLYLLSDTPSILIEMS